MAADVVTRTERMIAVDTAPGRSVDPLAALLADELAALGARLAVQQAVHAGVPQRNLVARLGGDGPAGLVLAGHLDTVPWDAAMRATTAPQRDGRTLYGRGSCDMKGPIAAQLEAAAATAGSLRRPLVLAYTYAEEIGCHGAQRLAAEPARLGPLDGARCIVGEPTGLAPITAHKGYAVAHVRLRGAPCHSSNPWGGADASLALGVLLRSLHELRERWRREADEDSPHRPPCTTLNTGLVSAGSAANVVPDRAEVALEWRPLPGADEAALRADVETAIAAACATAPGVTAELDWPDPLPPFAQRDDTLVRWLADRTGQEPGVVAFYTEAELYRRGLGVPTVVCGPGSIAQAHRVDESITFDELEAGVALYTDAIREFCGG